MYALPDNIEILARLEMPHLFPLIFKYKKIILELTNSKVNWQGISICFVSKLYKIKFNMKCIPK